MGKFLARLYKTDRARDFDHEQVRILVKDACIGSEDL